MLLRVATVEVPSPSVVVQREPAGGRRPHELRRPLVDRAREDEDYSVDIAYHADKAVHVGRDRGPRVREIGDAVPAHAPGDPKHLRERPRGGWRAEPGPAGRNSWHFACAASNSGDERSVPAGIRKPPLALGSGKLGAPWERMHCENFNSCEAISPGPAGPDDPDVCDEAGGCVAVVGPRTAARPVLDEVPICAVVVEPTAATPGPVECPSPQADKPPAASPTVATATAVSLPGCQYSVTLPRLPGSFARLTFSVVLSTITVVAFRFVPLSARGARRKQLCGTEGHSEVTAGAGCSPRIEVREPSSGSSASPKRLGQTSGKLHSTGLSRLGERRRLGARSC